MERRSIILAAIALCGCDQASNAAAPQGSKAETRPASLPFDNSTGFLDGYHLKIPRQGNYLWNGQSIDDAVLQRFLRDYAALPRAAGPLFVAFEPGVAQARADRVIQRMIDSGLCEQRRCAEVRWDVQRPVVNEPPFTRHRR